MTRERERKIVRLGVHAQMPAHLHMHKHVAHFVMARMKQTDRNSKRRQSGIPLNILFISSLYTAPAISLVGRLKQLPL